MTAVSQGGAEVKHELSLGSGWTVHGAVGDGSADVGEIASDESLLAEVGAVFESNPELLTDVRGVPGTDNVQRCRINLREHIVANTHQQAIPSPIVELND